MKIINIKTVAFIATIIILASAFVFVGCKKEDLVNQNNTEKKVEKGRKCNDDIMRGVTFEDIETLADKHNQYLNDIFVDFDFESNDYKEELLRNVKLADLDGASEEQKQSLCKKIIKNNFTFSTFKDVKAAIKSSDSLEFKHDIIFLLQRMNDIVQEDNITYNILSKKIDDIQTDAYAMLTYNDLLFTLATTEVFRKSAYYWFPSEAGGSGEGEAILFGSNNSGSSNSSSATTKNNVKIAAQVAMADATSIATGFTVLGFVAAFCPPATIGGLIEVAAEGAMSSAIAGIYEVAKNHKK